MIKHIHLIDDIPTGKFDSNHKFLQPTRHIAPTNHTHDRNMRPVERYTLSQLKPMQNVQYLMYSTGANKYICKYIGKMDYCIYTTVITDAHKNGTLMRQFTSLHNTKVSTSNFNEVKLMEKDKNKNRPNGRVISLMEMIQMMLLYGKVHTDICYSYSNKASRA